MGGSYWDKLIIYIDPINSYALGLSESDTRVKLIDPKLRESEWDESKIAREVIVTNGTILDSQGNRKPPRFADYLQICGQQNMICYF